MGIQANDSNPHDGGARFVLQRVGSNYNATFHLRCLLTYKPQLVQLVRLTLTLEWFAELRLLFVDFAVKN